MRTATPSDSASIALELLRHSLRLGHRRLSVARLESAIAVKAPVTQDDFHRCMVLALRTEDAALHKRVVQLGRDFRFD